MKSAHLLNLLLLVSIFYLPFHTTGTSDALSHSPQIAEKPMLNKSQNHQQETGAKTVQKSGPYSLPNPMIADLLASKKQADMQNSLNTNGINQNPIPTVNAADVTVDFNDTYTINGILQGSGGDAWGGETVTLHRNAGPTLASTTTAGDGSYSFLLSFTSADIGQWTYTVEFAGNLPFRKAGTVDTVVIQVTDPVDITVTVDKTNVGSTDVYTYTVTANSLSGNPVADGIQIAYSETYSVSNGHETSGTFVLSGGTDQYSWFYGDTTEMQNQAVTESTINLGLTFLSSPSANYRIAIGTAPKITVTVAYNFALTPYLNGTQYMESATRYFRYNQNITMHLNVSSFGSDSPAVVAANIGGKPYTVVITGGGNTFGASLNGNLDGNGQADVTFFINSTSFPTLTSNTVVNVVVTVSGVSNLLQNSASFNINLKEYLNNIAASTNIVASQFYYPGGSSITISGTVKDRLNNPAVSVPLVVRLRNGVYNPVNVTLETKQYSAILTNSTGGFKFIISNFDFGLTPNQNMYLNITVGTLTGTSWVTYPNNAGMTVELANFKYFLTTQQFFYVSYDGTIPNEIAFTSAAYNIFNGSLADLMTNGSYVKIRLLDQFGRIPNGLNVTFVGPNSYSFIDTVNDVTNKGNFTRTFAQMFTNVADLSFPNAGISFTLTLYSSSNAPTLQSSISKTLTTYGPDHIAPVLTTPTITGSGTGFPDPINIQISVSGNLLAKQNIRNVTIYYRLSDNLVDSGPIFTSPYTPGLFTYSSGTGNANYTIPFDNHGRWVDFYITAFDWAGNGTYADGTTANPSLYPLAGDESNTVSTTPQQVKMGDTTVDMTWANDLPSKVYINNQISNTAAGTNITLGQSVQIDVYIPPDNGPKAWAAITLHWKVITYNKYGNLLSNPSTFNQNNMTQIGINTVTTPISGSYRFQFIIDSGNFTAYFMKVDFYFEVIDIFNNRASTSDISNSVGFKQTEVTETIQPTSTTPKLTQSVTHSNVTATQPEVWNDAETAYITYNVTDSQSGINTIKVVIYYTLEDGTLLQVSLLIVNNGTISIPGAGSTLDTPLAAYNATIGNQGTLVNVTTDGTTYYIGILLDFNGIYANTTVSYDVLITDFSGNIRSVNDQNNQPLSFFVNNPIAIPSSNVNVVTSETVITIVTTDSNGNTITIVTTSQILSTSFGQGSSGNSSNAALVILLFTALVVGITLWYQRHNIMETFARRARARKVRGTLSELTDEIKRLGAEGQYRKAILLTWEALERVSREIVQAPRAYNQTAREYASFLSTVTIVDRETLLTLSSSFEAAKYGKDEPSIDIWDDAIKALEITVLTIIESGVRVQLDEDDEEFD